MVFNKLMGTFLNLDYKSTNAEVICPKWILPLHIHCSYQSSIVFSMFLGIANNSFKNNSSHDVLLWEWSIYGIFMVSQEEQIIFWRLSFDLFWYIILFLNSELLVLKELVVCSIYILSNTEYSSSLAHLSSADLI